MQTIGELVQTEKYSTVGRQHPQRPKMNNLLNSQLETAALAGLYVHDKLRFNMMEESKASEAEKTP